MLSNRRATVCGCTLGILVRLRNGPIRRLGHHCLSYTAWLECGGVAGTKTGNRKLPAGVFVEVGRSQLNTNCISATGFLTRGGSFDGESAGLDESGGRAGVGEDAVSGGGAEADGTSVSGGEKNQGSIASVAEGAGELVATVVRSAPRVSGCKSGGSPAGGPAGLVGWKRNSAAPVAGR